MQISKFALFITLAALSWGCARPIPQFTYQGEQQAAQAIQFSNTSEQADSYIWDFGDGTTSEAAEPTHKYWNSGSYMISLTAKKDKKKRTIEKEIYIEAPEACLVLVETEFGNMLIELDNATPKHQENFLKLVEEGFYEDLLFHRVIQGFMIQGGDPGSKGAKPGARLGSGGPGYTVPAEFVDSLVHVKGALAAARQGDQVNPKKASSGSQFYIVQGNQVSGATLDRIESLRNFRYTSEQRETYLSIGGTPQLDREYTVFGRVIEGLDVIDKIAAVMTGPGDRPREDVKMNMKIVR